MLRTACKRQRLAQCGGYADFDKGAPMKFILDPHGIVAKAA
jgi:hypothetical protein